MSAADRMRLHLRFCNGCDICDTRAEAAKEAREEPLDEGEIQGRENAYERSQGW